MESRTDYSDIARGEGGDKIAVYPMGNIHRHLQGFTDVHQAGLVLLHR